MCCCYVIITPQDAAATNDRLVQVTRRWLTRRNLDDRVLVVAEESEGDIPDMFHVMTNGGSGHASDPEAWIMATKIAVSIYLYHSRKGRLPVLEQREGPCPRHVVAAHGEEVDVTKICREVLNRIPEEPTSTSDIQHDVDLKMK